MREHADPRKESLTDPFLTPPEVFVKDYPDLYQPPGLIRRSSFASPASSLADRRV